MTKNAAPSLHYEADNIWTDEIDAELANAVILGKIGILNTLEASSAENIRIKRITDLGLVVAGAPVWLPLLIITAALVKLSAPTAPALFRQMRTGQYGNRFTLYKFRTMVKNAEEIKHTLREHSEVAWPDFKMKNDPRITPLGKFLRKTSLDELPQILNIIRGEMSWVGPRPTSFDSTTYETWQTERLDIKPGLTGPWQVSGRGTSDFTERSRMDINYKRTSNTIMDFGLIILTFGAMFKGK